MFFTISTCSSSSTIKRPVFLASSLIILIVLLRAFLQRVLLHFIKILDHVYVVEFAELRGQVHFHSKKCISALALKLAHSSHHNSFGKNRRKRAGNNSIPYFEFGVNGNIGERGRSVIIILLPVKRAVRAIAL